MATDVTPDTTPVPAPAARGWPGLRCPLCGETDGIGLDLDDLDLFCCRECDRNFTVDDVRELVAAWSQVLAWVESAPPRGSAP